MRLLIIGNVPNKIDFLSKKLSSHYQIPIFEINSCSKKEELNLINKIVRENKNWIIKKDIIKNIEIISSLADKIVFLDYIDKKIIFKNKNIITNYPEKIYTDILKKHIRKGIIIKNNSELNIYLKSVYKEYEDIYY